MRVTLTAVAVKPGGAVGGIVSGVVTVATLLAAETFPAPSRAAILGLLALLTRPGNSDGMRRTVAYTSARSPLVGATLLEPYLPYREGTRTRPGYVRTVLKIFRLR